MPQPAGHYVYAAFGWYEEPAIQKLAALTGIPADSAAIVRQRVDEWFCSSPASRDGIALPVADEVWHRVSGAPAAISPQAWRAACFEARILVTYRSWWRNPGMKERFRSVQHHLKAQAARNRLLRAERLAAKAERNRRYRAEAAHDCLEMQAAQRRTLVRLPRAEKLAAAVPFFDDTSMPRQGPGDALAAPNLTTEKRHLAPVRGENSAQSPKPTSAQGKVPGQGHVDDTSMTRVPQNASEGPGDAFKRHRPVSQLSVVQTPPPSSLKIPPRSRAHARAGMSDNIPPLLCSESLGSPTATERGRDLHSQMGERGWIQAQSAHPAGSSPGGDCGVEITSPPRPQPSPPQPAPRPLRTGPTMAQATRSIVQPPSPRLEPASGLSGDSGGPEVPPGSPRLSEREFGERMTNLVALAMAGRLTPQAAWAAVGEDMRFMVPPGGWVGWPDWLEVDFARIAFAMDEAVRLHRAATARPADGPPRVPRPAEAAPTTPAAGQAPVPSPPSSAGSFGGVEVPVPRPRVQAQPPPPASPRKVPPAPRWARQEAGPRRLERVEAPPLPQAPPQSEGPPGEVIPAPPPGGASVWDIERALDDYRKVAPPEIWANLGKLVRVGASVHQVRQALWDVRSRWGSARDPVGYLVTVLRNARAGRSPS